MGQFALGIRSLLVKATIFVVLAALLAWALGGTLFPKPDVADFREAAVQFDGHSWFWRVLVGGKNKGEVRWHLMRQQGRADPVALVETDCVEVAGPVIGADGDLYYAGRSQVAGWVIGRRGASGTMQTFGMPDRLAVEQQLGRVIAGLPLQDSEAILQQRSRVLDPAADPADES